MKQLLGALSLLACVLVAAFAIARAQQASAGSAVGTPPDEIPAWVRARAHAGPVAPTPPGIVTPLAGTPEPPLATRAPAAYGMPALTVPITRNGIQAFLVQKGGIPGIYSPQLPTITSVEFVTAAEVRRRVGPGTMLQKYPDTEPAVDVQLTGQFMADDPNQLQPHAELIFDGVTGNLLDIYVKP